jgi:co-chaperonin GroES (HSP10)
MSINKNSLAAVGDHTIVEILKTPAEKKGVIIDADIATKLHSAYYGGEVLDCGSDEYKPGDQVIVNQLAGFHIDTKSHMTKVLRTPMVLAKVKDMNTMKKDEIFPTEDRVLIEIHEEGLIRDGVYDDSAANPRDQATQRGTVIAVGDKVTKLVVGDNIAFDPYSGDLIAEKLKVLHDHQALFTFKK